MARKANKVTLQNYNLFEPVQETTQPSISSPPPETKPPKIKDACPRCGGRSLKTVRSFEHNGHTHYCASTCLSEDRTDAFYFTPAKEEEKSLATMLAEAAAKNAEPPVIFDEVVQVEETDEDAPIEVSASKYDQEKLFASEAAPATGKTIEALEYSRARTEELMRKFKGELPQSIMKADKKSRGAADLGTGSYDASTEHKGVWGVSGRGCANGALSVFPQNIGRALLLLYTEEGSTVFDPFAGHNSRMEFCVRAGRHYIGCDVSKKFMEFNRERMTSLQKEFPAARIELHEMDSRKIAELSYQSDFTITSPPYYDIEYYGDEYQQLGRAENYFEFLRGMEKVIAGNFKQLKRGAFCVYFINDFRREGKFYAYHIDTYRLMKEAGFTPWDMIVTDLGQPLRACFPTQVIDAKILPKRHEYGIVMRKL